MAKLLTIAECKKIVKERGGKLNLYELLCDDEWWDYEIQFPNYRHAGTTRRLNSKLEAANDAARFAMEYLKKRKEKK